MKISGDPEKDFFDQNPETKYFRPFKRLIEEEGKERASKIMWAIYLTEDPQSDWYNDLLSEKRKLAAEIYLKEDFDWDKYQYIIDEYKTHLMSRAEKLLTIWENKAEEGTVFFKNMKFSQSNSKDIMGFMKSFNQLFDAIDDRRKKYTQEKKEREEATRGGLDAGGLTKMKNATGTEKV